jgi:tRNA A37 threonylcarbamoyladenosine synthetase subunit TsaC/SUA5/YrdC
VYGLAGGACTKGIESTIIGFEHVAYRLDSIPLEDIEQVTFALLFW